MQTGRATAHDGTWLGENALWRELLKIVCSIALTTDAGKIYDLCINRDQRDVFIAEEETIIERTFLHPSLAADAIVNSETWPALE